MRAAAFAAFAVLFAAGTTLAQGTGTAPPVTAAKAGSQAAAAEKAWSFSAAASTYVLPDEPNYVQPAATADHDWLHLEGRFNYEDRDTGSAWFGYNFSVGDRLTFEFTPMVGAVFGNTTGVAPVYRGSMARGVLQLYSETEFVFEADDSADNFLYTWSEFEVAPVDWCRFGLVVQRTKAYKTEFDIQRGFFAGASFKGVDATVYVFNPDAGRPTVVVAFGVSF